jgi:hypothetical protein
VTRGLTECLKDLHAPAAFVLHGGSASYPLAQNVWALSIQLAEQPAALCAALLRPKRLSRDAGGSLGKRFTGVSGTTTRVARPRKRSARTWTHSEPRP